MNILILNWRDPKHPNAGGAEASTHKHSMAWVEHGHCVYWFTSFFKGAKKLETLGGVKVIRKGKQFFDVQLRAFWWYFFGIHPKFDLVVDQFHGIPFFSPLYVGKTKLAFIHEVASRVWGLNPWPKPFNYVPSVLGPAVEPWIFRLIYKNTPFLTVSDSTKDNLVSWGIPRKNIYVIQNGVDLSKMPKILPGKEMRKTAIFLGTIAKDKGIEDALRAFAEIDRVKKDWQFWVVGRSSPDMSKLILQMARGLKLTHKFTYWGYVSDAKKFDLLSRAHVLINPSAHEGWGLVNIEAAAVATPIVGYNVFGVRDSVKNGHTGVLVKRGDYRALAQNVINLVNSPKRYTDFQKNCVSWAKNFRWGQATRESLKLIENLVK